MSCILEKKSPCKVNLLLNILGKRADGFHELETVMHPVRLFDELRFSKADRGVQLSCSDSTLPTDSGNLVYRAAERFLAEASIQEGVRIDLEKRVPLAAGLGGGSGNAATTLLGLNELFGMPLEPARLQSLAASLGSDVPFFLQEQPALAIGRGEQVTSLPKFGALRGAAFLLIHPGFGISTAWAYKELARFPGALNGRRGRAEELVQRLRAGGLSDVTGLFYNSLEAPALEKHPLLALYQEFLREAGAPVVLMSGSGSTTFAIVGDEATARDLEERFLAKFAPCWTTVVGIDA